MTDSSSARNPVEKLAEEFAARQRRGERPSLTEYTDQYPQWADAIRELFPALALMEQLKPKAGDATGGYEPGPEPHDAPPLERLGDYRILREIGRGGMGVVYEAEQVSLGRHVALKVLPAHHLLDPRHLGRFQREAKAAARLHHTNIVPVYGVGAHDGLYYYVMQYIPGQGLDEVLAELRRLRHTPLAGAAALPLKADAAAVAQALLSGHVVLSTSRVPGAAPSLLPEQAGGAAAPSTVRAPAAAAGSSAVHWPGPPEHSTLPDSGRAYWQAVARLGRQVAEALAYAHGQGILHRDIKPSNLLVDTQGSVWVTDFGLAKVTAEPDHLTHTGDIVGTLRYMAPERFRGQADVRSDVYALGLTLYELLTLRPAYAEADRPKLIQQVLHESPPRPRQLNPAVPRDLETIVLKATDRDPARRYSTAQDLAEDLKRFGEDRPIRARRISLAGRLWRWSRRNPLPAGLAALIVLLTLAGMGGILWQWQKAEHAAAAEREARRDRELTLADMYTSSGLAAGARDDPRQAVLWFAHAARLAGDDRERADANRTRAAAWGRLALQPVRTLIHPAEWIENNMAFHPGGGHLLTHGFHPATGETDCRLWDLEREAALRFPGNPRVVSTAAWDATGECLAIGTPQGEVTICRFPSGEVLHHVPFAGRIARVLLSADGRYCAVAAGKRVRVWDCRQGAFATPEFEHPEPILTLAIHPRGELLATGCQDGSCRVFAVPTEENTPLFTPVGHRRVVVWQGDGQIRISPLFFDEGRGLLTLSQGEAYLRNARTGDALRLLPFGGRGGGIPIEAITLSGDGKHVTLAGRFSGGLQVRIYDAATAQPVSPNLEHRAMQPVWSATFSPDGQTLLTGSGDHTARLWSVPAGKPLGGPLVHPTSVSCVAFAPDGRYLATAQRGGLIRLWALPASNPRDYRVPVGSSSFVRLSRDSCFLLATGLSHDRCELRSTQVVDLTTGQPVGPLLEANGLILDAAFSPDGLQVATAVSPAASRQERTAQRVQQPGQLLLWDWRARKLPHKSFPLPSEPRKLDYSPDGQQLAVLGAKGELVVIDPATGQMLQQWLAHPPFLGTRHGYTNNGAVRFSPDNRSLLTFGTDKKVRVWDALTGKLRYELKHKGDCDDVQFSPDGRLVASVEWDKRVYVWELATGEQLANLPHPDWTFTAHFSPDGKHLLTASRDGMARLWDWRAGRQLWAFAHEHEVHAVAFTPDGRHVLSASDDGVLKIWEWHTGKLVCPPLALGGAGLSMVVTPDGKRVAVGGFMNELSVFHLDDWLAPAALAPDDLCLWGEIVSGQRVEAGGGVTNLTAEEWLQRWRDFRQRHPEMGRLEPRPRGQERAAP
jgi:WD40 repeat protein/serine/threonine protein kinase